MDEGTFWLAVWRIVGTVLAIFAVCMTASNMQRNYLRAEMIKAGADPIALACANTDHETQAMCILWIGKGEKK